ncbi:tumor protein p53-inducible nuclear protein 2 [Belonocnema kinseyi]|uniref:tumor protein p53-inducible nuclear protein 2 n=1 Tax=Belonocnema kinseyi TaxID=2817044 RepID=UPI00143D6257|nr:tumor protein p53-inducible nuclear protein 2 [Belonocnema kinseyi]XP_033209612.1 tumor protein p53-inducible nuclear protein 2 [Belonocnema kinseyi]XP_033209613.1 tumor protein p53-inducible nuclear protein 2 [Belonocnema kinseyi]XP_033209614.1 tumor protein p53-inducible nuclear protein 2 [Belonocnema kinseyi]XP_033209615.1 tumor protein p53-inducible nuclear protein 2 [Belonocnema kinseyi]XP_033209616.1 tumor protein p53-inducible nuclear protein 2 [Belonocnema kinseyi]
MLSSLANYLLRSSTSGVQSSREYSNVENMDVFPNAARLSQVEVEGNDWILIDRSVEGISSLDESWYVTPPACFTRASPVHLETSPLEDLLIEHPSMSVYRAAGPPIIPDTPPPTPDTSEEIDLSVTSILVAQAPRIFSKKNLEQGANLNKNIEMPRRPSIHDYEESPSEKNVEIVHLRSAQKIREKRVAQTSKRNRLERGNKVQEFSNAKGRRPRRQDRLRFKNSGANNNRKC